MAAQVVQLVQVTAGATAGLAAAVPVGRSPSLASQPAKPRSSVETTWLTPSGRIGAEPLTAMAGVGPTAKDATSNRAVSIFSFLSLLFGL
jgi:hypothetical protein